MKRIDSPSNTRIKELLRTLKRREGLYLIEGKKLVEEAARSGVDLRDLFVTAEFLKANQAPNLPEPTLVSTSVMKKLSNVETPPGIVATAARPTPAPIPRTTRFSALLLSIHDPGNLGTIIRSAEAAGADFLAVTSDCADPYSSKVIRSSAGSLFRLTVAEVADVAGYLQQLKQGGITVYALVANAKQSLNDLKPGFPCVIVIGSESHGLPKDISFENNISIPMAGKVESLNAAIAASLALYHFANFYSKT